MRYLFSTLNRYFGRLFLGWLGINCVAIIAVVSLFEATEYARRSIGRANISASLILEMVALKIPQHIELLLPFMILISTLLTFWRFHQTNEMAIVRSCGVSIWQYLGGLGFFILILGTFELLVFNPIASAMTYRLKNIEAMAFQGNEHRLAISETGLWLREAHQSQHSIFHAQSANLKAASFYDVTFYNFSRQGDYVNSLHAKKAVLHHGFWKIEGAQVWEEETLKHHQELTLPTRLTLEKIQEGHLAPETLSLWEISDYIQILEKSGMSVVGYRLHWHMLFAKIGLMISMLMLGAAFSLRHPLRGVNRLHLMAALGCGLFVYFLRDVVYALGLADKIPVILACWVPVIVTISLSSTLLIHQEDG